MKRVLFICEGNICRSPTAEAIFNHLIAKKGLENEYHAFSRGLIFTTNGQDIYPPFIELLDKDGIPHELHVSKIANRNDVKEADMIFVMSSAQKVQLKRSLYLQDTSNIIRLGDYLDPQQDIEDPYASLKYEEAYQIIKKAVEALVDSLR
ncbi:MAG: hypothetical protein J6328_00450 [Bacilli bacterium]|nr:hypothetical protein [Bacilli bacterium]